MDLNHHSYDVAPDGNRFLMLRATGGATTVEHVWVRNWFVELREKMQGSR